VKAICYTRARVYYLARSVVDVSRPLPFVGSCHRQPFRVHERTVEPTPGHYRVLRDGKPLRKANGMPFTLTFSPDTIRWRRTAIVELRKLGISV
jgi:hypothetical protein